MAGTNSSSGALNITVVGSQTSGQGATAANGSMRVTIVAGT